MTIRTTLRRRRRRPTPAWQRSYTLYQLGGWFSHEVADSWPGQRQWTLGLLQQETALLQIALLLGTDTLPPQQQVVLRTAAQLGGRGGGAGRA